jgi:hypothetical protein
MVNRWIKGWISAEGGRMPKEYLPHIFDIDGEQLIFVLYALPIASDSHDITTL